MMDLSQYKPIRTDSSNQFAHHTMKDRVPQIVDDVIERNNFKGQTKAMLQQLRDSLPNNGLIPPSLSNAPNWLESNASYQPYKSDTWLNSEWFFAETHFFNLLLQHSNYWSTGIDPFVLMKRQEIQSDTLREKILTVAESLSDKREERLAQLLEASLWGNRVDLSHALAMKLGDAQDADDLLVDERLQFVKVLYHDNAPAYDSTVIIITDNAGTELAMDLLLAAHLIEDWKYRVLLNVKMQPTYVSDATADDVRYQIEVFPAKRTREILVSAIHDWNLMIAPDFVWNSSHFMRDIATTHSHTLHGSTVIVKGDANYRRAVNDTIYPVDTPLSAVVDYMPVSTLFLRTLKSDPLCGVAQSVADKLDTKDPEWRVNGKRGVIQFVT